MQFDPYAKLAEIEARPPATLATTATLPPRVAVVAVVAASPTQKPDFRVADVADVATPPKPETFPYDHAFGGRPKTWAGCVVSLEEWRGLSEWERHGPDGRHWNGITRQWEKPEGATTSIIEIRRWAEAMERTNHVGDENEESNP